MNIIEEDLEVKIVSLDGNDLTNTDRKEYIKTAKKLNEIDNGRSTKNESLS